MKRFVVLAALVACGEGGEAKIGEPTSDTETSGPSTTTTDPTESSETSDGPIAQLSASELDFGELQLGESATLAVTLTNVGTESFELVDAHVSAVSAYEVEAQVPWGLAPGASTEIEVTFTASRDLGFTDTLYIVTTSDQPLLSIPMSADVASPSLTGPTQVNIQGGLVPCPEETTISMDNDGAEALTILDIELDGAEFSFSHDLVFPHVMEPGARAEISVSYDAVVPGSGTATLEVLSDAEPYTVEIEASTDYLSEVTDTFTDAGIPLVDVMLLLDTSCSMEDDNTISVQTGVPLLIDALDAETDWQLALFNHRNGCAVGGVLDSSVANASDLIVNNAFPGGFQQTYSEALLELGGVALSLTGPGECNEGLLRPNAHLLMVVISDESEQSGVGFAQHLNGYTAYVPPDDITIAAVVDVNLNCGDGSGAGGYLGAAQASGGEVLDVCQNWGGDLADVMDGLGGGNTSYRLSDEFLPDTLEVTVNGSAATFVLDDVTGVVTISAPEVVAGDVVDLSYAVPAECM